MSDQEDEEIIDDDIDLEDSENQSEKGSDVDSDESDTSLLTDIEERETDDEDDKQSVVRSIVAKRHKESKRIKEDTKIPESVNILIIPKKERSTSNLMSIFEYSSIISTRATEIQKNGIVFTDYKSHDPIVLAKQELLEKKCPYLIHRTVGMFKHNPIVEVWNANELDF